MMDRIKKFDKPMLDAARQKFIDQAAIGIAGEIAAQKSWSAPWPTVWPRRSPLGRVREETGAAYCAQKGNEGDW